MWPYWVMFLAPALAATGSKATRPNPTATLALSRWPAGWILSWLSLVLLIGFRDRVGGDWKAYLGYYVKASEMDFNDLLQQPDPGFYLLNWLSAQVDLGVYGTNLLGGIIFAYGLLTFCRVQPQPWLALAVAVPYLVIVVGMGYSRQAIALGLEMLGLAYLGNESKLKFAICIGLGTTFHKTALALLPIAALSTTRNRLWTIIWVSLIGVVLYASFLEKNVESLYTNYITADMQSRGALVRSLMNAIPAFILVLWRKRFILSPSQGRLWTIFAIISLFLPAVLLAPSGGTAVDRMALYMLPIQLFVFSRLPGVFGAQPKLRPAAMLQAGVRDPVSGNAARQLRMAILLYYSAVLFVWLNFGDYSTYWVPYRFLPFE
ncbi:hypothetical protein AMST5_03889 [freshwater sediment metagenome]|uniref:EpsG family protein n=1 Tax=freshwater sediment metagenome TaxID=556182 RepID=A0AA48M2U0_9ZZZZ